MMSPAEIIKLIDKLNGRIRSYVDHGSAAQVRSDEALAEGKELVRLLLELDNTASDLYKDGMLTLGYLNACRYDSSRDSPESEYQFAIGFFARAGLQRIGTIPPFFLGPSLVGRDWLIAQGELEGEDLPGKASHYMTMFKEVGEPSLLRLAILLYRRALAEDAHDTSQRIQSLGGLGAALRARFEATGDVADLDDSLASTAQALALDATQPTQRPWLIRNYFNALTSRVELDDRDEHVDAAITAGREAIKTLTENDENRFVFLNNMYVCLQKRVKRGHATLHDCEELIEVTGNLLGEMESDHHARVDVVIAQVVGQMARFDATNRTNHLNEAIDVGQSALNGRIDDPLDAYFLSSAVAGLLRARFARSLDPSDLNESCGVLANALPLLAADDNSRAHILSQLGVSKRQLFSYSGEPADLNEAIKLTKEALELTAQPSPERAQNLSNLCIALRTRFRHLGDEPDLEKAIGYGRAAIQVIHNSEDPGPHSMLSIALRLRFEQFGAENDLREAVEQSEIAITLAGPQHPELAVFLQNVGVAWTSAHLRSSKPDDLSRAIDAFRSALTKCSDRDQGIGAAANLINALRERMKALTTAAEQRNLDIAEAASLATQWTATAERMAPHIRARFLLAHAAALEQRYLQTLQEDDIQAAIQAIRAALALTPPNHPDRAAACLSYGILLSNRHRETGNLEDLAQARAAFNESATSAATAAATINAAHGWGMTAGDDGDWNEAARAFGLAIDTLPKLVWRGIARADREHMLSRAITVGSHATASALNIDKPLLALNFLERSRAILHSETLNDRTDLDRLQSVAPDLTDRIKQLRIELNRPANPYDNI